MVMAIWVKFPGFVVAFLLRFVALRDIFEHAFWMVILFWMQFFQLGTVPMFLFGNISYDNWRDEHEETFLTANGHRFFLSGGSIGRHGVGIVVGRSLYQRMSNVEFHAYSDRLCSLHFSLENVSFQAFFVLYANILGTLP